MTPAPRSNSKRRWRRYVLAVLLVAGVGLTVAYRIVTDPERLRGAAVAYLKRFLATEVSVDAVDFSLWRGLRVRGVRVADVATGAPPLFECGEIRFDHRPLWLLAGRFKIDVVHAEDATLRAVFEDGRGQFNLQRALRDRTRDGPTQLPKLPAIHLRDARTLMYARDAGRLRPVQELHLELIGEPLGSDANAYDVTWRQLDAAASTGRVRLKRRRGEVADVDGGTPWLEIEAATFVARAIQPVAAAWIELLGAEGRFRIRNYVLALHALSDRDGQITLEIRDASLSVPLDELEKQLPATARYVRLDGVQGEVRVVGNGASADLAGTFHGAACRARATLAGPIGPDTALADFAALKLEAELNDWTLPHSGPDAPGDEARFVSRWRRLRHFYRDFDPRGKTDVALVLTKAAGADQPIRLAQATVEGRGCSAAHKDFPYRMYDIVGQVLLNDDGIHVQGLTGTHDAGTIVASGWVEEFALRSASTLYFEGYDIALDDELCFAIGDRHRSTWESFNPAGVADIEVWMTRAASSTPAPCPWDIDIAAELREASASFEGFPYRVDGLTGRVEIDGDTIAIPQLNGQGGRSDVRVTGEAVLDERTVRELDLRIDALGVPLDRRLLAALPPETAQRLESLEPTGTADVAAQLWWDAEKRDVAYDLAVGLVNVSATTPGWPLRVEQVAGELAVEPGRLGLAGVRGKLGEGTIAVDGEIVDPTGAPSYTVETRLEALTLDAELRAALPEAVQTALADWTVEGRFDASASMRVPAGAGSEATEYAVRVQPAGATVSHVACPIPLAIEAGEVEVAERKVHLRGIRATTGDTAVELDGAFTTEPQRVEVNLAFDVERGAFTEELRRALPWRMRRLWNDLQPTGTFTIRDAQLAYAAEGDALPYWSFSGAAELEDAGFDAGVSFRHAQGRAAVDGAARGPLSAATLEGEIVLDRVDVHDWRVDNLRGTVQRNGDTRRWFFPDFTGRFYGGDLAAVVDMRPGLRAWRYDARMEIVDAGLEGIASAGREAAAADAVPPLPGTISGHCYLSGEFGDASNRRGSGSFTIAEAELYRLPLILAILQVINLTPPEPSAFQSARGAFGIVGDTITFDDLLFKGSALALIGSGAMTISTRAMDLEFVAVSPHRWAQTPVLTELLEGAARELMAIQVTGQPGKPEAVARPLRRVDDALRELLTLEGQD